MQHHFWETHAFSKMPFSIGNYIHLWSFFGNELLYYKTQYSLKCCSILFGSFEQYMPFSRCLLQLGNAWLFETKYNSFLGNVYNFVWTNCFITIQIVPWSVAAILLKNGCPFQEDWFSWECSILQNIYFDLGVPVSIPKYSMFLFGCSLYQNARLLQVFVTCTPWGYVVYIHEKWNGWKWKTTYKLKDLFELLDKISAYL